MLAKRAWDPLATDATASAVFNPEGIERRYVRRLSVA